VFGYACALVLLLGAGAAGWSDGATLMMLLDALFAVVALGTLAALGAQVRSWLPWRSMTISLAGLLVIAGAAAGASRAIVWGLWPGLAAAVVAAALVIATTWWGSVDLRAALAR
jgi:putative peptidoglycan lipid II flippase